MLTAAALTGGAIPPSLAAAAAGGGKADPSPGATKHQDSPDSLAVAEAKRTGKPVEVDVKRTEASDTVAQPDGKLVTTTYVQPKRVRKNGGWVDIDPTLQTLPSGAVAPKGATADVEFSGGGSSQPLVRMAKSGKELKLAWPKPLPKPVLNGSTAEYRAILPDVDLKLTATRTGFSQVVVVHTAAAAKNPELNELRLGLKGDGLTIRQAADGSLTAVDKSAGGTVFEAPVPVMWDSSGPKAPAAPTAPATPAAPQAPKAKSLAAPAAEAPAAQAPATDAPANGAPAAGPLDGLVPGEGAKVAKLKVDVPQAQDTMVLTPDRTLLDDPGTVYPVMIDPAWNTPNASDWAGVSRYYASQSYWHFTYNSDYVHDWGVGYCGDTSRCAPTDVKRAFFQIPNGSFIGKQILSAEFGTYESWSYSCDARPIELWNTGYISSGLNWNSQNASGFWGRYLQTMNTAKGWNGSCPGGWLEFGGTSGPVKDLVQDAANWGWPTVTFGLKAQNEGDMYSWKRLTDDAFLRVYYNLPPNQTAMSDMTMSPGSVCQSTPVKINNWPQVTAKGSDPDGEAVGLQFAVSWDNGDGTGLNHHWWSTGSEGATPPSNSFKGSGSMFSWSLPNTLPTNTRLNWEVRAWDGAQWGPWSSSGDPTACYFQVDTTAPSGPAITSAAYPGSRDATATLPWTDGVGKYGTFTLSSTATDVVKYQWGLDNLPSPSNEIATTGGATRTLNVLPDKPGLHFLSARAVDASGNVSQPETYYFNVLAGQPQRAGWSMDDASGTSLTGTGGGFDATPGSGATSTPGHLAEGLAMDGTANAYASTQGAVLDTTRGYTVSAWVNLTDASHNRSAVSQAGTSMAAFELGLRGGKWAFATVDKDNATGYGYQQATSDAPVALGQWTHLLGVYDATAKTVTLYVNGVATAPVAAPAAWAARGSLDIGRMHWRGTYTDNWTGALDEVKAWDRALTTADVTDVLADRSPAKGLPAKAVWHLDGKTGTAVGAAETDNATVYGGAQLGVPGVADKALHLDGVSGYARTARPQVDGTRDFSVSTWVRLPKSADTDASARIAVTQIGQHNSEFSLYHSAYYQRWIFGRSKEDTSADTVVRAMQPDCTAGTQVNGVPCFGATTGEWTHLLGVSDTTAKKTRLYINGYLVGEADYVQTTPWASPGGLQFGAVNREGANGEFFGGDLDDVRVYDRVVTATEARDLVQQRPQLAGRWKLNNASGTPLATPDEGPLKAAAQLGTGASIDTAGGIYPTPGALQLNGTTGYAATATAPLHTGQSFTLAGWADTAGVPTRDMTVLSLTGANTSAVTLRWHYIGLDANQQPSGQWQAEVRNSDTSGAVRTTTAHTPVVSVLDNWTHLAVSYDAFSDQLSLYANGQLENQACADGTPGCTPMVSWTTAPQPFEATSGLQFGRTKAAGAWGEYFSGELDDVWLYQGVLSPAQIVKLADYNTELGTVPGP
ncbi:LamG-like jellyroll fold domain-containing protein [Kitasatospora sp. NPDC097643]|uniref:LamG-like jellyroll fold domain-containing protein n=1 Tax=Kitasatospora sp. NPDC097643 TaxID=3157230 RepID=UPI00331F6418